MADHHPSKRCRGAWIFALLLASIVGHLGCDRIPPGRYAVDKVTIRRAVGPGLDTEGSPEGVEASEVEDKIATAESSRFLGIFPRGVVLDYVLFDPYILERDLARIERLYRARGYYEAHVRAGRVEKSDDGHVRITVIVQEGTPVLVGEVRIEGVLATLPLDVGGPVIASVGDKLKAGAPFNEEDYELAQQTAQSALADRGYAFAQVKGKVEVDLKRHRADITLTAVPGQVARFGPIAIEGLGDLPEAPVRRALDLKEGDLYSASKLDSARRAVVRLGVFSDCDVAPELGDPRSPVVPVNVRLVPNALRAVKLGGGLELDVIRADAHLLTGWENHNFLGGLRTLTIDLRPGIVLAGTRLPTLEKPRGFFFENRTRVELRQPGFLEARLEGIARAGFDMYPVIFPADTEAPDKYDLGYRDLSAALGLDRFFGPFYASVFLNYQTNFPFTYRGDLPQGFKDVVLPYVALTTNLDFRDNAIRPHSGIFIGNELQISGGIDALRPSNALSPRDLRIQPEVRAYFPMSKHNKKWTLALRATTGFLFPTNYGDSFQQGQTPTADDTQLVFFRGFFSGGPNSNRGYPFRGVGPRQQVSFFAPGVSTAILGPCAIDPNSEDCRAAVISYCAIPENAQLPACNYPTGGFTLWEASIELRFPISGDFGGAFFCDASDVSRFRFDVRLLYPHLSCGAGLHYDTPVGPLRLDAGFQLPWLQVLDPTADPTEKKSDSFFAISIGVGEAF